MANMLLSIIVRALQNQLSPHFRIMLAVPAGYMEIVMKVGGTKITFGWNEHPDTLIGNMQWRCNNRPIGAKGKFHFFCHGQLLNPAMTFGFYKTILEQDHYIVAIPDTMYKQSKATPKQICKYCKGKSQYYAMDKLMDAMERNPISAQKLFRNMSKTMSK